MPTITEALADIKILGKRIDKKRDHIDTFLTRLERERDPLERSGGSIEMIRREEQAVRDMQDQVVTLRRLISQANHRETITIRSETRSIFDWLTWRRDVAPGITRHLQRQRQQIDAARRNANQRGSRTVSALAVNVTQDLKPEDVIVNLDEAALAKQIEDHEARLGQLDGQLSLKNATVVLDYSIPTEED